jgi:hypothetical protein
VKAEDQDMGLKDKLAPFGILNIMTGLLTIIFGVSFETSDFIVDCLELWWDDNKDQHSHIKQLVINLDNGPQIQVLGRNSWKRYQIWDKNNNEIVLAITRPTIANISGQTLLGFLKTIGARRC